MRGDLRVPEKVLDAFVREVFVRLKTPAETAARAARSLLDASLLGIDTHGVEALDMYCEHLRQGGLDPRPAPELLREKGGLGLWDMRHGMGLSGARTIVAHAISRAREQGVYLAACRRTNHLGACGVYGKMAADEGFVAQISQQTRSLFAPPGGAEPRVGASPVAFAAPVAGGFPFLFDVTLAVMTHAQIKACLRAERPLPPGVALDKEGRPTLDPQAAWEGQVLPIGAHKGFGLAMSFELLHAVLSGNVLSGEVASIVTTPSKSAGTSLFMLVIDPDAIGTKGDFARRMAEYVKYIESSPARDAGAPPRYPGRRAGESWVDRRAGGIPVRADALERLDRIAKTLQMPALSR
jgi:LDH2 family malate/lactate/ureidoglycolate dehydrogenase